MTSERHRSQRIFQYFPNTYVCLISKVVISESRCFLTKVYTYLSLCDLQTEKLMHAYQHLSVYIFIFISVSVSSLSSMSDAVNHSVLLSPKSFFKLKSDIQYSEIILKSLILLFLLI